MKLIIAFLLPIWIFGIFSTMVQLPSRSENVYRALFSGTFMSLSVIVAIAAFYYIVS